MSILLDRATRLYAPSDNDAENGRLDRGARVAFDDDEPLVPGRIRDGKTSP